MKEVVAHYKVEYVPGETLEGLEAELAALQDSEPYNLARVSIGNTGFELVFDDRNAEEATKNVLATADRIERATSNLEETIAIIDDAHGLILDMAKYIEPEVLNRTEAFNNLIAAMPCLVEKLGGEPTRKAIVSKPLKPYLTLKFEDKE